MNTCPNNYMELLPYKYTNISGSNNLMSACIQWLGVPGFLVRGFIHREAITAGIIVLPPTGYSHFYVKSVKDIPINAVSYHRWYHIT